MEGNQDISAVQRGQEFFRLKEVIQSPGDIFEINESARAIYIGPDSDIGEVQVTYFNPDEPNALETATVAVNGPLVGRVDSLPVTQVPSTGQGARILVNPSDIVNANYDEGELSGGFAQRRFNVPIVLDLMIALKELPAIPEVRADRTLRFPQVPFQISTSEPDSDGSTSIIVPIYGRRMTTITVVNHSQVRGALIALGLVSLTPGAGNPAPRWVSGNQIGSTIFIPRFTPPNTAPQSRTAVVRASDAARSGVTFDAGGAAITGLYAESDQPSNPDNASLLTNAGFVGPRGMADLLLINIAEFIDGGAPPPEQTNFVDVFVKLADRET
jgi:hypothetical protein